MSIAERTIVENLPATEYHQHPAWSHSRKEAFIVNRKKFWAQEIARIMPPDEPTAAMSLGTLTHLAILEPEVWANRAPEPTPPLPPEVAPDGKKWLRRKGSDHEKWWAEWELSLASWWSNWNAEHAGKVTATAEQVALVNGMREAVMQHDKARWIVEAEGEHELSIFWRCVDTGLGLRSRLDKVVRRRPLICDIKTCGDATPSGFVRSCLRYGYVRQAPFYRRGFAEVRGEMLPFVFIAVESKPPHLVTVNELDHAALALGDGQNVDALRQIAECIESGDWRAPEEKQINTLSLPRWAFFNDYEVSE